MTTPAIDLAIETVGGVARLAAVLNVRTNRVSNWRKRGVPPAWIPRVSAATGGAVPCSLFDPVAFPVEGLPGADLAKAA